MKLSNRKLWVRVTIMTIVTIMLVVEGVWGISADPRPKVKTQPDGSKVTLRLRGDEYYMWMEDEAGYTVVKDEATGQYVYAQLDKTGTKLEATDKVVGSVSPVTSSLAPKILPPVEAEIGMGGDFQRERTALAGKLDGGLGFVNVIVEKSNLGSG